jgi:hypothetical protein
MSTNTDRATAELVLDLQRNRVLANALLFKHRHTDEDAPFHPRMVHALTSSLPRVLIKAFRGSAKSTTAEEVMITGSVFKDYQYGLVVGNTYEAACMRLASIKRELAYNERLLTMFGAMEGSKWGEDVLVLENGVRVQALGRNQSARGLKESVRNMRPDFVLLDDLEDVDDVKSPESREKNWRWLTRELIPALDPKARLRAVGTPLHDDSVIERLAASQDWRTLTIPLYTLGAGDEVVSAWPSRFPQAAILDLRDRFERDGDLAGFSQEYLCKPLDHIAKTFKEGDILVNPGTSTFAPRTVIVDPARTTKATSSRTGYVVTSWVGSKLIVHDALGAFHSPSEQVAKIFELNDSHHPMTVAVEADGLEEWLMQPLRVGMTQRGSTLPLQAIRAPRDKKQFIAGLEPFFRAHEVEFASPLPDLKAELMAFPYGKLDIINALAYAVRLRPGAPVYPNFSQQHVKHFLPGPRAHLWLALNGSAGMLVSVLIALEDGGIHILNDWVREGPMDNCLQMVEMDLNSLPTYSTRPQIMLPYERALATDHAGIGNALRRNRLGFREGKRLVESLESLTDPLRTTMAQRPMFTVSPEATWSLNALAGGYARDVTGRDVLVMRPQDNIHATVAQATEVLAATLDPRRMFELDGDNAQGMTIGSSGRPYRSMLR